MLLKVTPAAPSLPAIRTLPLGKRAATAYWRATFMVAVPPAAAKVLVATDRVRCCPAR